MHKLILIISALWSFAAFAQVPVVEAGTNAGGNNRGQSNAPAAAAGGGNDLTVTMYNQLEALQREVQTLRGRVEEQDYQIKRMQTEQRDRYLDIDRRLSSGSQPAAVGAASITTGTPPSSVIPAPVTPVVPSGRNVNPPQPNTPTSGIAANTTPVQQPQVAPPAVSTTITTPTTTTPTPTPQMDEQELYRTALNLLLEQSNYEQSIQYFQTYITTYPRGRYLTNSYYWQGEAYILVGKFSEARDVFNKIINEFPQEPKAPDAMLKLGVVYQEMGDRDQARKTWQEIATRYPENTTVIKLATNYLRGQ